MTGILRPNRPLALRRKIGAKALLILALGLLALAAGGRAGLGKIALGLGLPGLAAPLIADPAARGVALYRAGDVQGADLAFKQAGRTVTYNRGLSLALLGDYALSRAYFDAVLFTNPGDSQARDNRRLVDARIPPHQGAGNQAGRIAARARAPGDTFNSVQRPLAAGRRQPDAAWLAGLADDPGEFLRLRLAEEYLRRLGLGLTPPQDGDPW